MKRKNILASLAVFCCLLLGGHFYIEHMITHVIQTQIAENKEQIVSEMKQEILSSLKNDEDTQQQVQGLMTEVVENELRENGHTHVRHIIRDHYPQLQVFLTASEKSK